MQTILSGNFLDYDNCFIKALSLFLIKKSKLIDDLINFY